MASASLSSVRQGWLKYFVISVFSDSYVAACAGAVDLSTKLNSLLFPGWRVHGCLLWKGYITVHALDVSSAFNVPFSRSSTAHCNLNCGSHLDASLYTALPSYWIRRLSKYFLSAATRLELHIDCISSRWILRPCTQGNTRLVKTGFWRYTPWVAHHRVIQSDRQWRQGHLLPDGHRDHFRMALLWWWTYS